MSQVPIPLELATEISELAARRAREGIRRRDWSVRAQESIFPAPEEGKVGIGTTLKYLKFQDKGTKPYLMTSLEGKVVPIRGRFIRVNGVGLPGMGYQDRKNKTRYPHTGPIWREQRWRHPGLDAQNFMRNAIQQALFESRAKIRLTLTNALSGRPPTPAVMPQRAFWANTPPPPAPSPAMMPRRAGWL